MFNLYLYQRTLAIYQLCLWYQGKDKNFVQFILSFTIETDLFLKLLVDLGLTPPRIVNLED